MKYIKSFTFVSIKLIFSKTDKLFGELRKAQINFKTESFDCLVLLKKTERVSSIERKKILFPLSLFKI